MSAKLLTSTDLIGLLPDEFAARIAADEYFCDITVVVAEKGNVAATIDTLRAAQTEKKGKVGVAVHFTRRVPEIVWQGYPKGGLWIGNGRPRMRV